MKNYSFAKPLLQAHLVIGWNEIKNYEHFHLSLNGTFLPQKTKSLLLCIKTNLQKFNIALNVDKQIVFLSFEGYEKNSSK